MRGGDELTRPVDADAVEEAGDDRPFASVQADDGHLRTGDHLTHVRAIDAAIHHIPECNQPITGFCPIITKTDVVVLLIGIYRCFQRRADEFLAVAAVWVAHVISSGGSAGTQVERRGESKFGTIWRKM